MNELINYEAVYRTASATPGLLMIYQIGYFKYISQQILEKNP